MQSSVSGLAKGARDIETEDDRLEAKFEAWLDQSLSEYDHKIATVEVENVRLESSVSQEFINGPYTPVRN